MPNPTKYEPPHDKTNKMNVCPAKTQISIGICPVWSESSLCAQWVVKDPSFLHADSEDWSDWADAQDDLSLRWAHNHIVGFVMRRLIFWSVIAIREAALGPWLPTDCQVKTLNETAWMRRLIWVSTGGTRHFVGFCCAPSHFTLPNMLDFLLLCLLNLGCFYLLITWDFGRKYFGCVNLAYTCTDLTAWSHCE